MKKKSKRWKGNFCSELLLAADRRPEGWTTAGKYGILPWNFVNHFNAEATEATPEVFSCQIQMSIGGHRIMAAVG
jgi:hypothetical protein